MVQNPFIGCFHFFSFKWKSIRMIQLPLRQILSSVEFQEYFLQIAFYIDKLRNWLDTFFFAH